MKTEIEKRIAELSELQANNNTALAESSMRLSQLKLEVRAGEDRVIAIGNRIAELAALLEQPAD